MHGIGPCCAGLTLAYQLTKYRGKKNTPEVSAIGSHFFLRYFPRKFFLKKKKKIVKVVQLQTDRMIIS